MPLATVKFAPGFDKQSTAYGAEGKWIDGENIRNACHSFMLKMAALGEK